MVCFYRNHVTGLTFLKGRIGEMRTVWSVKDHQMQEPSRRDLNIIFPCSHLYLIMIIECFLVGHLKPFGE